MPPTTDREAGEKMNNERNIEELLDAQLDSSVVKSRVQGGVTVDYVEGWYAIEQANFVFGYDGWSCETVSMTQVQEERKKNDKGTEQWYVGYTAKVRVSALGIVRDGFGAGSGISKDQFSAHESAVKEAETDALKRALKSFGYRFGLALYDKAKTNVSGKKSGAKLGNGAADVAETKARQLWAKIGARPNDFGAFVDSHGKKVAYDAIVKADKEGISLDEAVRYLTNA